MTQRCWSISVTFIVKGEFPVKAVKTWPGLKRPFEKLGEYLLMVPGKIDLVVSPVNSAVSGWSVMISVKRSSDIRFQITNLKGIHAIPNLEIIALS